MQVLHARPAARAHLGTALVGAVRVQQQDRGRAVRRHLACAASRRARGREEGVTSPPYQGLTVGCKPKLAG
jgi:hypothetical protein